LDRAPLRQFRDLPFERGGNFAGERILDIDPWGRIHPVPATTRAKLLPPWLSESDRQERSHRIEEPKGMTNVIPIESNFVVDALTGVNTVNEKSGFSARHHHPKNEVSETARR
jgi:hypothetical protein